MRVRHLVLVALLLPVIAACDSPTGVQVPDRPPAIEGTIVARDVRIAIVEGLPTIHVKESEDDPCGIIFAVDEETTIALPTRDDLLAGGRVTDLTVGRRVRVWARGAIAESCPAQGRAAAVEILDG